MCIRDRPTPATVAAMALAPLHEAFGLDKVFVTTMQAISGAGYPGVPSLDILGKLNPLAKPLALDIQGKVRDLELAPLTPYSVKFTGHGIERGKLSMDVSYRVQPDGQLNASNNIVLNQLSFGEKVEGSTASLPVKLAVALLADRNGVIDINLPISGSLNDPQFSLGSVILKVIVNLITKAITAPFTLLASAFGGSGGEELGTVPLSLIHISEPTRPY